MMVTRYFDSGDGASTAAPVVPATPPSPDVKAEVKHEESVPYARLAEVIAQKNALQAQIDKTATDQKAAEDEAAKKKGEWEKLATTREQELNSAKAQLKDMALRNATTVAAVASNAVDPDAVYALLDKSKIVVKEDGTVEGVKEAVDALLKDKPYLVKQTSAPGYKPGAGSTGSGDLTPDEIGKLSPEQYIVYRKEHPDMLSRR